MRYRSVHVNGVARRRSLPRLPSKLLSFARLPLALFLFALLLLLPAPALAQLTIVPFVEGFDRPTGMVQDPADPAVQYVVEKFGRIWVIRHGTRLPQPFLDISADVWQDEFGERGLLGLAFPPDVAVSGRAFVFFSSRNGQGGDTIVSRYKRSAANPFVLDPASRFDLEWAPGERYLHQPSGIHRGGKMVFGPDGMLYLAVGDGGPLRDPDHRGQDLQTPMGKILRVDVSVPDADPIGYRIPPTNPFANGTGPEGARPHIWALGLRNPWRIAFDDPARGGTGALLIADVGQDLYEEIDYQPAGAAGRNYGWSLREGLDATDIFSPLPPAILPLRDPIFAYRHGPDWGSSISGGHVYRGRDLAASFKGRYVFADFVSRRLFSMPITLDPATGEALPVSADQVTQHTDEVGGRDAVGRLSSIDVDAHGELYLVDYSRGRISRLVMDSDRDQLPDGWEAQFGLDPLIAAGANGASGDPDADGRTNAQELAAQTHPSNVPSLTRYLAEGSSSSFFETTIGIANPGTQPASVLVRFLRPDSEVMAYALTIAPKQHATIRPAQFVGMQITDFSTMVEADREVVVERTMTWTSAWRYGSHSEAAVPAPSTTWFLAEGATHGPFDTFYLLENPTDTRATVDITYLLKDGSPIVRPHEVAPHGRETVWVDTEPGLSEAEVSASIRVTNNVGIIVERAMYRTTHGTSFIAGHASAGVTEPSNHWFFAEGATGSFFDLFLLLANPATAPAQVTVRYLLPDGARPVEKTYTLKPQSRETINVELEAPELAANVTSMVVDASVPIVAERAMYWPNDPENFWTEAHNSVGATSTGTAWAIAGGEEGGPFAAQTFVLIANTSAVAGTARVTILREHAAPLTHDFPLSADSRSNVRIGGVPEFAAALGSRFGVLVESLGETPVQLVVERATYTNDAAGTLWVAGSNSLATKLR